ncbi:MAG: tetratricopeptide repeat protein [Deltaproteobacteria bacterium]|nr:tetratricopeptide repeat protein [Nannocystaceae bacterium]
MHSLRPSRLSALLVASTLAFVPACGKNKKGTKGPVQSQEDAAAKVAEAKKTAKSATLVDLANKDLESGRYVSATKRAEEALKTDDKDADAYTVLGAARWRAGDYDGSTEAYRKAVEINPKNFGAVLGLARNLQAGGQHKEAADLQDVLIAEDKEQVDPRLTKFWSYYSLGDADQATAQLDEIFKRLPATDQLLPMVQAFAAFVRPLAGKGPFFQITGATGSSDANINASAGLKYSGATIGGEFAQVVFFEGREECLIDADLAKTLKLPEVAKFKPIDSAEEQSIVIIPEIKFGDLKLEKVPAIARSLEGFAVIGEKPGVVLGRQALQAFGSIGFDFPKHVLTVTKDAPTAAPEGMVELPFVLLTVHAFHWPAIPIALNGSEYRFFVYLGGLFPAGVSVAKKQFLKSGYLPRTVENPEDATNGLKILYVDKLSVGDRQVAGVGAHVLVNTPPDPGMGDVLTGTGFELGGYLNSALVANWRVTYSLPKGRVYIDTDG